MEKFTKIPINLFRVQRLRSVCLRTRSKQRKLGFAEFDVNPVNSLILPSKYPSEFREPNGMQVWPLCSELIDIVDSLEKPYIYFIKKGTRLPLDFCLYREEDRKFSIQTTKAVEFAVFNALLTKFVTQMPRMTAKELLAMYNLNQNPYFQ